ncbi:MAG: Mbeg1-like protein [Coriobacteriales bacterium]|jgi:hypothetical protein
MQRLSTSQLLSLAILSYALDRDFVPRRGAGLRDIVDEVDRSLKRRMEKSRSRMDTLYHEQMTYMDWFSVLDGMRVDERLCALELCCFAHDERDAKLLCFTENTDDGVDAYVCFGGTGAGEWPDNCTAGYLADSEQQLRALQWTQDKVLGQGFHRIVATGHSKGGNKALYVAVRLGAAIEHAVSFDGEGFSVAFLNQYRDQIAAAASRIESYVLESDYVSGLLNPIVAPENFHVIKAPHVNQNVEYHAPSLLYAKSDDDDPRLTLASEVDVRSSRGQMPVLLTNYMQSQLSDDELERFCDFLGAALENRYSSNLTAEERRDGFADLVKDDDFALVTKNMVAFFQSMGRVMSVADVAAFFAPPLPVPQGPTDDTSTPEHED